MARRIKPPSPAMIVALIALFVAIGGVGYAASKIDTEDIKSQAVTKPKIAKKAVTTGKLDRGAVETGKIGGEAVRSGKIRDGAVKADDLQDQGVTTGKIADQAVTMDKIADGSVNSQKLSGDFLQGPVNVVEEVSAPTAAATDTRVVEANCPAGQRLIAGGAGWTTTADNRSTVNGILRVSRPIPAANPTGWQASGQVETNLVRQLRAYAICIPA